MSHRHWSDAQLIEAVRQNKTWSDVLTHLGLVPKGGSFQTIKKHTKRLGLDTSHFTPRGVLEAAGAARGRMGRSHEEHGFVDLFTYGTSFKTVKRYLPRFKDNSKCSECGQGVTWNGRPLTLQVDHINGDSNDHRLENLRYLCPNCHTQTETFSGRLTEADKAVRIQGRRARVPRVVLQRPVAGPSYKINWPPDDELQTMLANTPARDVAKRLGVSDVAISKRCRARGIPKPGRGAWVKEHHSQHNPGSGSNGGVQLAVTQQP